MALINDCSAFQKVEPEKKEYIDNYKEIKLTKTTEQQIDQDSIEELNNEELEVQVVDHLS